MTDTNDETLNDALARHEIELPNEQVAKLDAYCQLLWDWNTRLNLTRHTDYEKFVSRDVVDSLQLAALLDENEEVLDVGTGGGVPGIILAVLRPDIQVSLSETTGKKAKAVDAIVADLKLPIALFHGRAEDVLGDFRFSSLVARAVGPLWKMLRWFEPHWLYIGKLLAVKGPKWLDERLEAKEKGFLRKVELRKVASYPVAGNDGESVILKVWPKPET